VSLHAIGESATVRVGISEIECGSFGTSYEEYGRVTWRPQPWAEWSRPPRGSREQAYVLATATWTSTAARATLTATTAAEATLVLAGTAMATVLRPLVVIRACASSSVAAVS